MLIFNVLGFFVAKTVAKTSRKKASQEICCFEQGLMIFD